MLSQFDSYLPWLLPPLLGAIIGYVTNYIAIRMLFRPLRPWRICGLRVPLTPGIIPSQRHKLARKMGEMVGDHLLTSDDIADTLDKEGFRKKLLSAVEEKLDQFICRDLSAPISLLPSQFHDRLADILETVRWKLLRALTRQLESEQGRQQLTRFCQEYLDVLLSYRLKDLMDHPSQTIQGFAGKKIEHWLDKEQLEGWLDRFIDQRLQQLIDNQQCLNDLLPGELVDGVLELVEQELPAIIEQLSAMLDDPEVREQLQDKIRDAIANLIDSIDGLSALIGALFDMEKIYAKLPGFMDKAAVELKEWLASESVRQQISSKLRDQLNEWLNQPLSRLLEKVPYERVVRIRGQVSHRVCDWLTGDTVRHQLLNAVEKGVETIEGRPLSDWIDPLLPEQGREKVAGLISTAIVDQLSRESVQHSVEGFLENRMTYFIYQRPLGQLSRYLPSDGREELAVGLFDQLVVLLKKEIPPLVETLNICQIVEDKVNSLDILKVEGLLMGIMKEQFKYINLFGALLGMLIGLLNLVLLQM
ncbi:DUF445 family protein [Desulfuromonas acetoxidans]|uniref:DUF445 family protein n=1 Tax=Desulfuromonas acetoxidans TaxID=891 RepID=UPI00292D4706|nr:DUF445 family protein [Desulfuromonas acetoxidans]